MSSRLLMWMKRAWTRWAFAALVFGAVGDGTALALEIGQEAPDFSLPSTSGEKLRLGQFRGKSFVLIEFYLNDFVPT